MLLLDEIGCLHGTAGRPSLPLSARTRCATIACVTRGGLVKKSVAVLLAVSALAVSAPAISQTYPVKPIRLIVPFQDRKSTRLNSSHSQISYAVFCLKK